MSSGERAHVFSVVCRMQNHVRQTYGLVPVFTWWLKMV